MLRDPRSQALTGTEDQAGVGLSGGPKPSGVAWNLEGFLGWQLASSLGLTNPKAHSLSPARLDPRAKAQAALVSWGSVHSALGLGSSPPRDALPPSPEAKPRRTGHHLALPGRYVRTPEPPRRA